MFLFILFLFFFLRLFMRNHIRSTTVRNSKGPRNQPVTSTTLCTLVFGFHVLNGSFSSGAFNWYSSGRLETLHLRSTTPFSAASIPDWNESSFSA